MIISLRSQYAVMAVLELGKNDEARPVKSARIAAARHIPPRFLNNILAQLQCAGIVQSIRGSNGGHALKQRPGDLNVGAVVRAVQGPLYPVRCLDPKTDIVCPLRPGCVLLPMWDRAHRAMTNVFDSTSFRDLVEREAVAAGGERINHGI